MKRTIIFILTLFISANVYGQDESILIYEFDKTWGTNQFAIYARISESNLITGFTIADGRESLTPFRIEINPENFENFRNALYKFIEWDDLSVNNGMNSFQKEIPFTVTSRNVLWSALPENIYLMIEKEMTINFIYKWSHTNAEFARSQLEISSDTVNSLAGNNSFIFSRNGINTEEVISMLENLTEENIHDKIQSERSADTEMKRQRMIQDELFR